MEQHVLGIHHVTAITGDPQQNIDFYAGVLGLRFVKKTVNFDVPDTYHLYYGDTVGHPGTALTKRQRVRLEVEGLEDRQLMSASPLAMRAPPPLALALLLLRVLPLTVSGALPEIPTL